MNSPKIRRWPRHGKTQVDILTHIPRTWAQIAGASLSALSTNSQSECDHLPYEGQVVRCEGWGWCVARAWATVQSGILRPLCFAVHQAPHNCNVIQRVGKHISSLAPNGSSNEPSNDTCLPVHSKFEASALPFPNTNCSRLELAIACRDATGDDWRPCWVFRPAIFGMMPFNVASHLCCYFGVHRFFGSWESRTSQFKTCATYPQRCHKQLLEACPPGPTQQC